MMDLFLIDETLKPICDTYTVIGNKFNFIVNKSSYSLADFEKGEVTTVEEISKLYDNIFSLSLRDGLVTEIAINGDVIKYSNIVDILSYPGHNYVLALSNDVDIFYISGTFIHKDTSYSSEGNVQLTLYSYANLMQKYKGVTIRMISKYVDDTVESFIKKCGERVEVTACI